MTKKLFPRSVVAALLSIALFSVASAQNVSSSARGAVTDANGNPIANATVTLRHVPSGSTRTAQTGNTGNYFQPGLRVGGPYEISAVAEGFRTSSVDNIFFSAGTQPALNLVLEPTGAVMDEIVVSGTALPVRDLNNGVGSAFSAEDIGNTPSAARDVIGTLLRDPLAQSDGEGNLSVGGINPRFNGLAIDGSLQQDDFGLGSNTYATERSPINLDAIESASLVSSDYDVSASGFTGGLVNITTKSGTNEWDGSAFYYWQHDGNTGEKFDGGTRFRTPLDETEYGVTLGGPIIKDKLFFFVSYDEFESASSVDFAQDDADNAIQPGFFDALGDVIQSSLGYDPGSRPDAASTPETSERTLVKLDWNINDLHRAAFTYQKTEEGGFNVDALSFEDAFYAAPVDLEATTFQFFSDWSDTLSTTLRINQKEFARGQICNAGTGIGQIEIIEMDVAELVGTPLEGLLTADLDEEIVAGCDRFRHANEFDDERLQILAKADYFAGDHVITAGIEYEDFSLFNLFASGGARGNFQFDNFTDLVAGTATVRYENDISNDINQAASSWGYEKYSLFIQDSWQISDTFELGFGIRYESFEQSDSPVFSQDVFDQYNVRTDNNLDGKDLFLPRVSFRWDIADRTSLTGGFGRFAGGDPKVWISNAFQLPTVRTSAEFTNVDPTVIPQQLIDNVAAGTPVPIDFISSDFEIPSDWKASLRLEHEFDIGDSEDYVFTAQWLHTQTEDGFQWTNLAQTALPQGVAPDGRPIYADLEDLGLDNNLTQLGNYSDGESNVFSLALAKRYDYGLDFNFSYTFQDVEMVTAGTSSRGVSNWRAVFGTDRNNPSAKTSAFQVEHSFKLNLGYEKDFFGTGESFTRFDLFARRLSGDTFTHTFNVGSSNSLFGRAAGENPFDTDALYIPTSSADPAVVFASGFDQDGFFDYVKGLGRGSIKPFNDRSRWITTADLRIQQEIPGLSFFGNSLGDNNFRIVLDIENVLNLLNRDWGRWADGPGFDDNDIVTADLVLASDVAANGIDGASALTGDLPRTNCLQASDCVYRYNSFRDRDVSFTDSLRSVYRIRLGIRFDF